MAAHETLRPPELSVLKKPKDDKLIAKHSFKVITPIFGGSATAGKILLERPIREMEIRGMLRLWWRCLKAPAFQDSAAMFAEEAKLFGSTETPSPFDVLVKLHGQPGQTKARGINPGLEFTVELRWRQDGPQPEVIQALRTWSLLGGYGSRTRRGYGSLILTEQPANLAEVAGYVSKGTPEHATTALSGALALLGPRADDAMEAWSKALAAYRGFRKGEGGDDLYSPADVEQPAKRPLNPSSGARMASPVITKPLPVDDKFCSMLLVMNSPHRRACGDQVTVLKDVLRARWKEDLKEVTLP